MIDLECPHCGCKAMPVWRKLLLGPTTTTACRTCGGRISTDAPRSLAAMGVGVIPLLLLAILGASARYHPLLIAATAICLGVMFITYLTVPLSPRGMTAPSRVPKGGLPGFGKKLRENRKI